jgi:hypothetical protein
VTPAVGEHYRPGGEDHPPGAYRVVGAGDPVALLRVSDGSGKRAHTGDLRRVPADGFEAAFEPTPDPDAGFAPGRSLRNALQGLYWNVRRFL